MHCASGPCTCGRIPALSGLTLETSSREGPHKIHATNASINSGTTDDTGIESSSLAASPTIPPIQDTDSFSSPRFLHHHHPNCIQPPPIPPKSITDIPPLPPRHAPCMSSQRSFTCKPESEMPKSKTVLASHVSDSVARSKTHTIREQNATYSETQFSPRLFPLQSSVVTSLRKTISDLVEAPGEGLELTEESGVEFDSGASIGAQNSYTSEECSAPPLANMPCKDTPHSKIQSFTMSPTSFHHGNVQSRQKPNTDSTKWSARQSLPPVPVQYPELNTRSGCVVFQWLSHTFSRIFRTCSRDASQRKQFYLPSDGQFRIPDCGVRSERNFRDRRTCIGKGTESRLNSQGSRFRRSSARKFVGVCSTKNSADRHWSSQVICHSFPRCTLLPTISLDSHPKLNKCLISKDNPVHLDDGFEKATLTSRTVPTLGKCERAHRNLLYGADASDQVVTQEPLPNCQCVGSPPKCSNYSRTKTQVIAKVRSRDELAVPYKSGAIMPPKQQTTPTASLLPSMNRDNGHGSPATIVCDLSPLELCKLSASCGAVVPCSSSHSDKAIANNCACNESVRNFSYPLNDGSSEHVSSSRPDVRMIEELRRSPAFTMVDDAGHVHHIHHIHHIHHYHHHHHVGDTPAECVPDAPSCPLTPLNSPPTRISSSTRNSPFAEQRSVLPFTDFGGRGAASSAAVQSNSHIGSPLSTNLRPILETDRHVCQRSSMLSPPTQQHFRPSCGLPAHSSSGSFKGLCTSHLHFDSPETFEFRSSTTPRSPSIRPKTESGAVCPSGSCRMEDQHEPMPSEEARHSDTWTADHQIDADHQNRPSSSSLSSLSSSPASSNETANVVSTKDDTQDNGRSSFHQSMMELRKMGWYWGPLTFLEAQTLLAKRPDGTFLVRDSGHNTYILSLSFRVRGETYHTRIEHSQGRFSFWSQPQTHSANTMIEFIEKAVAHSISGQYHYFLQSSAQDGPPVEVPLLYPLSRFQVVPSMQHLARFIILTHTGRRDLIDQLPLPPRLLTYLREKQFYVESLEAFEEAIRGRSPLLFRPCAARPDSAPSTQQSSNNSPTSGPALDDTGASTSPPVALS